MTKKKSSKEITREDILKDLERASKKFAKEHPKLGAMSRDYYRTHGNYNEAAIASFFGNYTSAISFARKNVGQITRHDIHEIHESEVDSGTHFVTAAIAGAPMPKRFIKPLDSFLKVKKAKLNILGMRGILKDDETYDETIVERYRHTMCAEYIYNTNLFAIDMKLYPQQFNPLTSMDRIGSKSTSLIVAHPKQQMAVAPVGENMNPHMLWSTGSITRPYYAQTRSGRFSSQEHVNGGLIVEVKNDKSFHVRQVQFNKDGTFSDLNKLYTPDGVETIRALAATLGDIHAGWVDPTARKATFEQLEMMRPEHVFVGDVLDCSSISHHSMNDRYAKHKLPKHLKTLELELHTYAQELELYCKAFPWIKLNLVYGNHEEHLLRYLKEGRYVDDIPENHYLSLELARYMLDDKNPVEEWCRIRYPHLFKNVKWLHMKETIRIDGIMMSAHGHKGHSGSRGSAANMEKSYGKSNTGHCFSEDTEILTKDHGWVTFDKLSIGTKVMSMNLDTLQGEWNNVNEIFKYDHYKELIHFDGKTIDLMVTPDHAMVASTNSGGIGPYRRRTANDVSSLSWWEYRCAVQIGNNEEIDLEDDELRLLAWIITEGSFNSRNTVRISQSDKPKVNHTYIENICQRLGISYTTVKRYDANTVAHGTYRNFDAYRISLKYCDRLTKLLSLIPNKLVPRWVTSLSKRQVDIFLHEMLLGDGTIYSSTSMQYFTKNECEVDIIQEMCAVNGYRTCKLYRPEEDTGKNDMYLLSICTRPYASIQKESSKLVSYSGNVWCVSVDNQTLLVRRNGKVSVCGNTHSAQVLRDSRVAGCMCVFDMPYTEGSASKWSHSNIFNFKNQAYQIYNSFGGDWRL